jgi:hypothetical protein
MGCPLEQTLYRGFAG